MSSDGTYGGRGARRAGHATHEPSRASAGAAAAILILAAIFGFGGGGLMATAGGGNDEDPAAATEPESTPDEDPAADDDLPDDEPTEEAGDGQVTLNSPQDGQTIKAGDQIDYEGRIDPPAGDVSLTFERSFDGGESWETFVGSNGDPIVTPASRDDGSFSGYVITLREGEIYFRLVGQGPAGWFESNPIAVTVQP